VCGLLFVCVKLQRSLTDDLVIDRDSDGGGAESDGKKLYPTPFLKKEKKKMSFLFFSRCLCSFSLGLFGLKKKKLLSLNKTKTFVLKVYADLWRRRCGESEGGTQKVD